MTNTKILQIAMEQSAEDIGCYAQDFLSEKNVIIPINIGDNAKKCYKAPITCNFVSYGNNVVAATTKDVAQEVEEYINKFEYYHLFETPSMYYLNDALLKKGQTVCFMAQYYLPDLNRLTNLPCDLEVRLLESSDFVYLPQWSNALCDKTKQLNAFGFGAYDKGKLVGLAACSKDAPKMWQIGVDVLLDYRKRGVASALTSRLALEILKCGKVPFYCAAWSNIPSNKNAIKSGFSLSWIEMTVKPISILREINGMDKDFGEK